MPDPKLHAVNPRPLTQGCTRVCSEEHTHGRDLGQNRVRRRGGVCHVAAHFMRICLSILGAHPSTHTPHPPRPAPRKARLDTWRSTMPGSHAGGGPAVLHPPYTTHRTPPTVHHPPYTLKTGYPPTPSRLPPYTLKATPRYFQPCRSDDESGVATQPKP